MTAVFSDAMCLPFGDDGEGLCHLDKEINLFSGRV